MNKIIKLTLITTFILSVTSISQAQETISPEKTKLIAELIKITKVESQLAEITDDMLASMETTYPLIIVEMLEKENRISEAEKDKMSKKMMASYHSFSKKFRERLPNKINYSQYVKDAMYPLYDKFFTEKELSDLIAFYKTETGQKVIVMMPKLMKESNKLAEKLLLPKLLELVDEIITEETKAIKDSVADQVSIK